MAKAINPDHLKWFEGRGISQSNVESMGIYSGQQRRTGDDDTEVVEHPNGELIVFPFVRNGVVVNEKYRGSGKRFFQKKGGVKCFYNADILRDPALHEGRFPLVIVEGEMDMLAVQQAGNPFVVSVPDGAPPARDKDGNLIQVPEGAGDIDPDDDDKYSFIYRDWENLKKIKRIVIAVDADEPGRRLAEELVRRLGRSRCYFVTFPEGCKDFNDIVRSGDLAAVPELINAARPYPVSGVYTLDELPAEPDLTPVSTGFHRLDDYLKPFYPALMVVTGFAGSGKSSWVNQMVAQMAALHGWKAAIASFEMRVKPFVTGVLGSTYQQITNADQVKTDRWINSHFVFISPEPGDENDSFDVDWLIEKAVTAVVRHGIRVLVIDPWNEVEHAVGRRESLTDYTGRAIRALKRFGREFECLVIIVAHPTKSAANKDPDEVSLYDVSDSAHFANKADFGVVVARVGGDMDCVSEIFVRKVRYQPLTGRRGSVTLTYSQQTMTFSQ